MHHICFFFLSQYIRKSIQLRLAAPFPGKPLLFDFSSRSAVRYPSAKSDTQYFFVYQVNFPHQSSHRSIAFLPRASGKLIPCFPPKHLFCPTRAISTKLERELLMESSVTSHKSIDFTSTVISELLFLHRRDRSISRSSQV